MNKVNPADHRSQTASESFGRLRLKRDTRTLSHTDILREKERERGRVSDRTRDRESVGVGGWEEVTRRGAVEVFLPWRTRVRVAASWWSLCRGRGHHGAAAAKPDAQ